MKLYRLLNDKKVLWEGTEDGVQSIRYEAPARIPNRHFLHHLHATPDLDTFSLILQLEST